jgi:hydrogenase-1 operon protein HyaF
MNHRVHLPLLRESEPPSTGAASTGLAAALLGEITECLAQLADGSGESSIDLRSLPLTDADREELSCVLGRGEVSMTLTLGGDSEIWETAYPGVWWVRHRGGDGDLIGDFIEIATIPRIAVAHRDDIRGSQRRLARWLDEEQRRRAAR